MANPTIGPLFTSLDPDIVTTERAKAAGAFAAAVLAIKLAPQTLGTVARIGLGVEVTAAGEILSGPLTTLNVLPQPFGFVPPGEYGLANDYYVPSGFFGNLPDIVPGGEQRAAAKAARVKDAQDDRVRAELAKFQQLAVYASNATLQGYINDASNAATNTSYADPAGVVALLQGELSRRTVQSVTETITRGLYNLGTDIGGSTVADQQGQFPQGSFLDTQPTPQTALPSGFVEIPSGAGAGAAHQFFGGNQFGTTLDPNGVPIGTPGADAGTTTGYKTKAKEAKDGNFPDKFFAIMAGDP